MGTQYTTRQVSYAGDNPSESLFAFTATPKGKTLELFGRLKTLEGKPEPFHVYTMKQAIEDKYILEILAGYHSFKLVFRVGQNAGAGVVVDGDEMDQALVTKEVMRWVKPQAPDHRAEGRDHRQAVPGERRAPSRLAR